MFAIRGHDATVTAPTAVIGVGTGQGCASPTPSIPRLGDYVVVMFCGCDGETQTFSPPTAPVGWTGANNWNSGTGGSVASNCRVGVGHIFLTGISSLLPNAPSLSASAQTGSTTIYIAIAAPAPPPTVTGLAPSSGLVGASVVITGTNLGGASAVTFGGVSAPTYTVDSPTQITATVPAGAVSGTIAVTTPSGTAASAGTFTVEALTFRASADFELGSSGAPIAVGDPGSPTPWSAIVGTAPVYRASPAYDTLAAEIATRAGTTSGFSWAFAPTLSGTHYARLYFYPTATGISYGGLTFLLAGAECAHFFISLAGQWSGYIGGFLPATPVLPLNTWTRIELYVTHSATVGRVGWRLYWTDPNGTTPDHVWDSGNLNTKDSCDAVRFGIEPSNPQANSVLYYLDNIMAGANGWPGPAEVAPPPPSVYVPKVSAYVS